MTTPRATRLKFWLRPLVKSSLKEAFPAGWRLPSTSSVLVPSSNSTASLMAWNVCWTSGSIIDLSSRSEMTAIARADCPVFRSLYNRLATGRSHKFERTIAGIQEAALRNVEKLMIGRDGDQLTKLIKIIIINAKIICSAMGTLHCAELPFAQNLNVECHQRHTEFQAK